MNKACSECGKDFTVKPSHAKKRVTCSFECLKQNYKRRMAGAGNPRYYDAAKKACFHCEKAYRSYNKARQYCSQKCWRSSPAGIAQGKRNANGAVGHSLRLEVCHYCANVFTPQGGRPKYCSRACMMAWRRAFAPHREDYNQAEVIHTFRLIGAGVMVMSHYGQGFPDLCIGHAGLNYMVEVKNPDNKYGRKGLSPSQKKWAAEMGGTVDIVHSPKEAIALLGLPERPQLPLEIGPLWRPGMPRIEHWPGYRVVVSTPEEAVAAVLAAPGLKRRRRIVAEAARPREGTAGGERRE